MTKSVTPKKWTTELVQQHAQVAVAVELYTLPFYITAMTSVRDTDSEPYKIIRSVLVEEMLHLQLTANLCLALDTVPDFRPPQYSLDIPYFKSYDPETGDQGIFNVSLGPLNSDILNTMLDIETPEDLWVRQNVDHSMSCFPYNSIGEMYDALIIGISHVGANCFSWTTKHQQEHWPAQDFPQIISNYSDAQQAIQALVHQGEGHVFNENLSPPPWTEKNFIIPSHYQLKNDPFDPAPYNKYAHFGRFIQIKNNTLPHIYTGFDEPQHMTNKTLQQNFYKLLIMLETLWEDGSVGVDSSEALWKEIMIISSRLIPNAQACWQAEVIPNWFIAQ
ncbi:MAG: hypothetical protein D3923_15035 [Candidatus Electrothrix sp. AR3]|nr:hypothetical protein [Candidatus Electrothrix sp. AR3]